MAYEDFSTFTEVDPNAHLTINTINKITHLCYRNEDAYIYKDYGVNNFLNYDIEVETTCNFDNHTGVAHSLVLSSDIDDVYALSNALKKHEAIQFYRNLGNYYVKTRCCNGVGISEDTATILLGTKYYYKYVRNTTSSILYIYTDAGKTILFDTLSATCSADGHNYLFGSNTWNTGHNLLITILVENIEIITTPTTTDKNIPTYFNSKFITHH